MSATATETQSQGVQLVLPASRPLELSNRFALLDIEDAEATIGSELINGSNTGEVLPKLDALNMFQKTFWTEFRVWGWLEDIVDTKNLPESHFSYQRSWSIRDQPEQLTDYAVPINGLKRKVSEDQYNTSDGVGSGKRCRYSGPESFSDLSNRPLQRYELPQFFRPSGRPFLAKSELCEIGGSANDEDDPNEIKAIQDMSGYEAVDNSHGSWYQCQCAHCYSSLLKHLEDCPGCGAEHTMGELEGPLASTKLARRQEEWSIICRHNRFRRDEKLVGYYTDGWEDVFSCLRPRTPLLYID